LSRYHAGAAGGFCVLPPRPVSRFFTFRFSSNRFHPSIPEVLVRQRSDRRRRRETIRKLILRLDASWYRAPGNEEFMSMDRLSRVIVGGCLTLAVGFVCTASGCRSSRNDVPKGKPFSTNANSPSVGFNSDPHPSTSVGQYPGYPSDPNAAGGAGQPQLGTPTPSTSPLNLPTNNRYGPTGTSGGLPNQ
jgi:hypothetical protein